MGHTRVSTTLDLYSHVVDDEVYKQTAKTLDGAFTNLTNKKPEGHLPPGHVAVHQRTRTL